MSIGWLRRSGRVTARRALAAPLFGLAMASVASVTAWGQATPGNPTGANGGVGAGATGTGGLQSGASGLQSAAGVSTPPSPNAVSSEPPLPGFSDSLLPNLFGLRPFLTDHGIAVIFDTVDEFAGNITGGGGPIPSSTGKTEGGASFAGQYGFETDVNWETLAGLTGFSTHTIVVGRYGGHPASTLIGDNLNPSQEIYGAGGNVVVHLVQFFGEETLAGGKFDLTFGRIPLDDDFASSPLYCAYESNSICGNPKGFTDNISHSSYPDANWAFRVRVRPLPDYYIQSGIFFTQSNIYNVAENFRTGFTIDSSYISGEAFPVEIGWEPSFGPQHLPGHYKLGFVYDNNPHSDNYFDINGAPFALTGLPPRTDHGSTTAYVLVDQMVLRNGPGASDGIVALAGYVHNDPTSDAAVYADEFYAGAQDLDFWPARPLDQINALINYQHISGYAGKTQALDIEEGIPVSDYYNGASGIQTWTMDFELNYAIHVFRGFTFAPDFQYYIRPNAQDNLPDAAFLGFKTHLVFF